MTTLCRPEVAPVEVCHSSNEHQMPEKLTKSGLKQPRHNSGANLHFEQFRDNLYASIKHFDLIIKFAVLYNIIFIVISGGVKKIEIYFKNIAVYVIFHLAISQSIQMEIYKKNLQFYYIVTLDFSTFLPRCLHVYKSGSKIRPYFT